MLQIQWKFHNSNSHGGHSSCHEAIRVIESENIMPIMLSSGLVGV